MWVHKPCLVNERVQSGWCVPCGGMFSNAAGDDPAAGVDTACDGDSQGLKDAVNACLSAVPSGEACCSTDTNCADPSSARCGSAGCVDMPEWDVSLVTDMSELFKDKADFNADISAWDTSQVTDMGLMFGNAFAFNQDIGSWNTSQVTACGNVPRRHRVQSRYRIHGIQRQVTSMGGMFYDAGPSTEPLARGIPRRSRTWLTCSVTPPRSTKISARGIPRR